VALANREIGRGDGDRGGIAGGIVERLTSPPPATVAVLVTLVALAATLTVSVKADSSIRRPGHRSAWR